MGLNGWFSCLDFGFSVFFIFIRLIDWDFLVGVHISFGEKPTKFQSNRIKEKDRGQSKATAKAPKDRLAAKA
jgi:hypothetical protein